MQNTNLISLKSNTPTCITVSIEINPNKYKRNAFCTSLSINNNARSALIRYSNHFLMNIQSDSQNIKTGTWTGESIADFALQHQVRCKCCHCKCPITFALNQRPMDVIAAENEGINIFENRQEIKSMIQKARNNSSAKGFIYSEYKVNKPPELKQERLKRIWMISKGQEFFDEVYGNIDPGFQFLKNDWFMGPFYSYDPNEELLRKNQENRDLQINQSL